MNSSGDSTSQYERLGVFPTVDSGVRFSETQLWDESTRPTRPELPADVTYGATGRRVGSHLIAVHDHLRDELEKIRRLSITSSSELCRRLTRSTRSISSRFARTTGPLARTAPRTTE